MPPPDDERTLPPRERGGDVSTAQHYDGGEATLPPRPEGARGFGVTVAGYDLLGELGRGGMGVVYHAVQTGLNRPVALKMVLSGDQADSRDLIRFLAEAEAVASIRHDHVVQVYEFGDAAGRPFFAMEFLPAGSLADRLRAGPLTPAAATDLVRKLALGLQAAHGLGIVHRDLKPGNILFDANGEPKITDFGLAKRGGRADLTRTGAVMGTPAYMAPEQARGQTRFIGPAADVYALGVVLFECLSGRCPFESNDPVDLLMKVAEEEAPSVRRFAPHVSRNLDKVVRKCLAKDPRDRYATATELAEDLRHTSIGEPPQHASTGRFGHMLGVLGKGRHTDLTRYARLFFALAVLLLVTHSVHGFVGFGLLPEWVGTTAFVLRVLGLPALLIFTRRLDPRPVTSNEWVLWSVWGGYLLACGIAGGIQKFQEGSGQPVGSIYPVFALLSGVAFFSLAPTYWGWLFVIGTAFLLLPFPMTAVPEAAPFLFGGCWAVCLLAMAVRLKLIASLGAGAEVK